VLSGRLVQYAIMIDAGSTGSRIHIYKFNNCGPVPAYEYEVFRMTHPALFAFGDDPARAAKTLDILLDVAVRVIPSSLHSCTPVVVKVTTSPRMTVKVTTSLRMIGFPDSNAILSAVHSRLSEHYPFPIHHGTKGIAIIGSGEQGVFSWVTANYLLGVIGGVGGAASASSHAVLDLGGASAQIVFEPTFDNNGKLEPGEHKYNLDLAGTAHVLYQHLHIGLGLMRARARVHELVESMASTQTSPYQDTHSEVPNPCLARNTHRLITMHARNVTMSGADVGSFEACSRVVELVLAKDATCAVKPCAFNGVYQPNLHETFPAGNILLLSYFYDRLAPLHPPSEYDAGLTVDSLATDARDVCAGEATWERRWGGDPAVLNVLRARPEYCLDLTFMHALLRVGYELSPETRIRIGQKVAGTEISWCLGAALAMVTGELTCRA
jgi:guanosine-diphosphatase